VTAPEHSKPIRLAAAAFRAAQADKSDSAARLVKRISDECGGEGIFVALMAWIDTYADHATDGAPTRSTPRMAFIQESTGQLDRDDSDRLPADIRWAGMLIAARCGLDEPRFKALINEMPRDGADIGQYVMAVLLTVARTVNGLPRGFARMGRAS
jgi:hypothetical protein